MIIVAKNQWIKKIKKQTSDKQSKLINVEMLENAATVIFRMIQRKSFLEEVKALSSSTHNSNGVNQSSSLFKLHAFLDSNCVLRVGGRLSRSKLTSNEAHPVVLPKTSNITEAVVIWSHEAAPSHIVVWTCLGRSLSEREGLILCDTVSYSPVLQAEQYILR